MWPVFGIRGLPQRVDLETEWVDRFVWNWTWNKSPIEIFAKLVIFKPRMALKWKVMTSPPKGPRPHFSDNSSLQRQTIRRAVGSKMFFTGTSNLFLPHCGGSPRMWLPSAHQLSDRKETKGSSKISLEFCGWNKAIRGDLQKPPSHWPSSSYGLDSQKDELLSS